MRRTLVLLLSLCLLTGLCSFAGAQPRADSAVLFIGDGMGPNALELTRLAGGGRPLEVQRLPYSGVVTTVEVSGDVSDSAAAATALATGFKTKDGMVGVSPGGERLETLLERCQQRGKATGLVTTDNPWGATPAGFAAHVGSRGEYAEIARQLVGAKLDVLMGFGTDEMTPKAAGGAREDGLDLLQALRRGGYAIVTDRARLAASRQLRIVGLFGENAPSLAEMVSAALLRLGANRRGFFLMVEEAGPDGAGHSSDPAGEVTSVRSLDRAVRVAEDYARAHPRMLVVVTADHETGGLLLDAPAKAAALAKVKGDKWEIAGKLSADRSNVAEVMKEWAGIADVTPAEAEQIKSAKDAADGVGEVLSARSGVRWTGEGHHTKTPVRVFAFGPGAERFAGELDNTQIPVLIADILGVGAFPKRP